jgi:hypothetical protein
MFPNRRKIMHKSVSTLQFEQTRRHSSQRLESFQRIKFFQERVQMQMP